MIVSKPKASTLFSLTVFTLLALGGVLLSGIVIMKGESVAWYQYMAVFILTPFVIGLGRKLTWHYKVVTFGKDMINVKYPVQLKNISKSLKEIKGWKENIVKTPSGRFREVSILFDDNRSVKLSYQENTEYEKVFRYLEQKCKKKKVND